MQRPSILEDQSTLITRRNLALISPERVEELKTLFGLNQAQLDTLRGIPILNGSPNVCMQHRFSLPVRVHKLLLGLNLVIRMVLLLHSL